eukprot:gnl/TRDRNA2_/TRDRNA2_88886_c2_seq1.p1 gnl/TRDRNA2_/TRDRNA2_88886_c2~~gnl/TRDRNA2_/TRDRNA2_88886_c2_seq1.p1  ORF type:complete len:183 (+),score=20.20 gnl/TRDRNA2_/TRDRNA2_88886_c2_seq1:57-551(+)
MSPGHHIAVGSPDNYMFARDTFIGSSLLTPNSTALVTGRSQVKMRGVYAPWTTTSNLYVGTGEDFFLVHGLANVDSRFERLLCPLFSILEFVLPWIHELDENSNMKYIHPVASLFWSIVGVLYHDSSNVWDDDDLEHSSEKDRAHPIGSLVAWLARATEGDRIR